MRVDNQGVPIIDEPLFSWHRIYWSYRRWKWFEDEGYHFAPLWKFLIYSRRPYASRRWY